MTCQQRPFQVTYSEARRNQQGVLRLGKDFHLDFEAPRSYFIGELPPRLMDLLRISMAVFVVDRYARRNRLPSRSWRRGIKIKVEVLQPDFWVNSDVLDALREVTEFVTGDDWEFEFVKDSPCYEWSRPLLSQVYSNDSPLVCLYSGGLDSAAGLGLRLRDQPDRPVLPVTIRHQPAQHDLITSQLDRLRRQFGGRIEPLVVETRVPRRNGLKWEPSYRGRSMLFTALGVVVAAVAGVPHVEVFESGIGAINIPLMAGMTGSKSTRNCHPEFLRRMSRLASIVTEHEITFRLPFLDQTKGEMVRAVNEAGLADLARETISCAHYPLGHRRYQQCGVCSSCIFRRQAMLVGGIEEPEGSYSFDLFGTAEAANVVPQEKLKYLKAFLMQVAKWDDIEKIGRLPEPVSRHLLETHIHKVGDSPEAIIDLLVRHRDEWKQIVAKGRRVGYRWARLLDPARTSVGQGVSHAPA